jgi:hypothetical protein
MLDTSCNCAYNFCQCIKSTLKVFATFLIGIFICSPVIPYICIIFAELVKRSLSTERIKMSGHNYDDYAPWEKYIIANIVLVMIIDLILIFIDILMSNNNDCINFKKNILNKFKIVMNCKSILMTSIMIYNVIKYRKMGYANDMGNDYIVHPHAGAIIRLYITVIVINSIYIIYYTIYICTYICYMVDKYHDKDIRPIIFINDIRRNTNDNNSDNYNYSDNDNDNNNDSTSTSTSTSTNDSDNDSDNVIRNTGGDDSVV